MDNKKPLVLVVDNDSENIDVINNALQDEYCVLATTSGNTALAIAKAQQPDLVLMDVMMPVMDGYETCSKLKEDADTSSIPVIFVTALQDEINELNGFDVGGVDYVHKPICPAMLRSRVRTHISLRKATDELSKNNFMLTEEKNLMVDIVNRMRSDHHFDERGLRFFSYSEDKTNGDLVLSAYCNDGHQYILAGDFTGHGLPASVCGPLVYYIYYRMVRDGHKAEAILREVNEVLCRQLPPNLFMAAVMFDIYPQRDIVRMWNAGMPPILERHEDSWLSYEPTSMALGIADDVDFSNCYTLNVDNKDMFYMYSDGVIEAVNEHGEMYHMERLKARLTELMHGKIEFADILDAVKSFASKDYPLDDTTLVEVTI